MKLREIFAYDFSRNTVMGDVGSLVHLLDTDFWF